MNKVRKLHIISSEFDEEAELKKLEGITEKLEDLEMEGDNLLRDVDNFKNDDEDSPKPKTQKRIDKIAKKQVLLEDQRLKLANLILDKTGKDPLEYENKSKINGLITSYAHYMAAKARAVKRGEEDPIPEDDTYKRIQNYIDEHLNECRHINQEFISSIPFIFGLTNKEIDIYTVRYLDINDYKDRKTIETLIPLLGERAREAVEFINTKSKIITLLSNELIIRISQIERAMKDFEPIKQAYLDKTQEKEVAEVMQISPEKEALAKELARPGRVGEIAGEPEDGMEPNIIQ